VRQRQGKLAEVRADADLYPDFPQAAVTDLMLAGAHLQALVDAGELDRAAALVGPVEAMRLDDQLAIYQRFAEGLAALRLAQGDPRAALEVTDRMARWERESGQGAGTWVAWRSQAALAHAGLGEAERALELAGEQVELATAFGAPGMLGSALRIQGRLTGDEEGIELLQRAASSLEGSGMRLEHARALVDLGAARRRAGRPAEAREDLRSGLDAARRCEATALAEQALEELIAAGGRPRRASASEVDGLTPSERRVAEMAASGMSNKEIAQALFVTVRTVETHLFNSYRKLEIKSRSQLKTALSG
jgi:DNA-binding CsgD family transcriptional regulator